jgi:hypothetical protein
VYLVWGNQGSYVSHCIYVDDRLQAQVRGDTNIACIPGMETGLRKFTLLSLCTSDASVSQTIELQVVAECPPGDPVRSMTCGFDPEGFSIHLEGLATSFQSVDVFQQQSSGFPAWLKTLPLTHAGDQTLLIPEIDSTESRVFLQFFDEDGHGFRSVECPRGPSSSGPPEKLQVFQREYEPKAGVVLCWIRGGGGKGFEVLVDEKPVAVVGAMLDTHYVNGLEPGEHTFEVRVMPWEGPPGGGAVARATLRKDPPGADHIRGIHTAFLPLNGDPCEEPHGELRVSWDAEAESVFLVDVYLGKTPGPLRYLKTVFGDPPDIRLPDVLRSEEIGLQFFGAEGFGSRVFGGRAFRRGDSNSSGRVDLSDAVNTLTYLFSGGVAVDCADAADANDDGELDLSDALTILDFLFRGAHPPHPPGPFRCGLDLTEDALSACGGVCSETQP